MSIGPIQSRSDILERDRLSAAQNQSVPAKQAEETFWGEDGFSFGDILDAVNPLQRIPIVSDIYRQVTGDTQSTGSNLAGGALFGGVLGFAVSFINSIVEEQTGKTIGGNMLALLQGESIATEGKEAEKQLSQAPAEVSKVQQQHADLANRRYKRMQNVGVVDLPMAKKNSDDTKYSYLA